MKKDILVLGKVLLSIKTDDKNYDILHTSDFKHSQDVYKYLEKNCIDVVVLDIFDSKTPTNLKNSGFKGLIIGASNDPAPKYMMKTFMEGGFDMYYCYNELEENIDKIMDTYTSIPKFQINLIDGGVDMEIYEHIIKDAGQFMYKQFADSFFEAHPLYNSAFISQDKKVIDFDRNTNVDEKELYDLMQEHEQYVFLFKREGVEEAISQAA